MSHNTEFDVAAAGVGAGFDSPFPNVFFSAPQTTSVMGSCNVANNYGKCTGYTRAENVPYAGTDTDGERWNMNVDGMNGMRGNSFWPDAQNV